jgi:hypothetical protein
MKSKKNKKKLLGCGCVTHGHLCVNCFRETCPQDLFNGQYCLKCVALTGHGTELLNSRTCAVPGCSNRTDQGYFRGEFCMPCFSYIVRGGGSRLNPSQAYQNELVKSNLRALSAMRRTR